MAKAHLLNGMRGQFGDVPTAQYTEKEENGSGRVEGGGPWKESLSPLSLLAGGEGQYFYFFSPLSSLPPTPSLLLLGCSGHPTTENHHYQCDHNTYSTSYNANETTKYFLQKLENNSFSTEAHVTVHLNNGQDWMLNSLFAKCFCGETMLWLPL